jgi:hypothetical protein
LPPQRRPVVLVQLLLRMPAAASSFPSLRRPVRAARTLCTCQPVASVRSPIAAPCGRCSRARIDAFLLGRTDGIADAGTRVVLAALDYPCRGTRRGPPLRVARSVGFASFRHGLSLLGSGAAQLAAVTATSPAGRCRLGRRPFPSAPGVVRPAAWTLSWPRQSSRFLRVSRRLFPLESNRIAARADFGRRRGSPRNFDAVTH